MKAKQIWVKKLKRYGQVAALGMTALLFAVNEFWAPPCDPGYHRIPKVQFLF